MKVVNDFQLATDDKEAGSVFLVMLDLSCAFDTVNHAVFLERLQHDFGMEGSVLAWLTSYFSGRVQALNIIATAAADGNAPRIRSWALQFPAVHGSII